VRSPATRRLPPGRTSKHTTGQQQPPTPAPSSRPRPPSRPRRPHQRLLTSPPPTRLRHHPAPHLRPRLAHKPTYCRLWPSACGRSPSSTHSSAWTSSSVSPPSPSPPSPPAPVQRSPACLTPPRTPTGATLISLFALLNKVAGAYGILAVLLSGGAALSQPLGQLTMYAYSIASLVGFIWGLQKISEVRCGSALPLLGTGRGWRCGAGARPAA